MKGPDSGPLPPAVLRGQDAVLQLSGKISVSATIRAGLKRRILAGLDSISAIVSKENPAKKRIAKTQKRAESEENLIN